MLDLKFLRENPEIVKQNIRNKFQDAEASSGGRGALLLDAQKPQRQEGRLTACVRQQKSAVQADRCADGTEERG